MMLKITRDLSAVDPWSDVLSPYSYFINICSTLHVSQKALFALFIYFIEDYLIDRVYSDLLQAKNKYKTIGNFEFAKKFIPVFSRIGLCRKKPNKLTPNPISQFLNL